jgi:hypothetical protein
MKTVQKVNIYIDRRVSVSVRRIGHSVIGYVKQTQTKDMIYNIVYRKPLA